MNHVRTRSMVYLIVFLLVLSVPACGPNGSEEEVSPDPSSSALPEIAKTELSGREPTRAEVASPLPAESDREAEEPPHTPAPPADTPLTETPAGSSPSLAPSHIAQVWANEGGDKVTRDELRAVNGPKTVLNSVWDGQSISLFGARNEVVSFNLVLEAPTADATGVDVTLTELTGPDGASITTRPATARLSSPKSGDDVFNYVDHNIELFYVRYLEIKGLSTDLFYAGYDYDERHIPERCRRPYDADGEGTGRWEDRPCHNKYYPEVAMPLELHSPFTILAGTNQSIWGDIYIPKTAPAGIYTGMMTVTEDGALTWQIPISLRVRDFALPDLPNARTMLYLSSENINDRYLGEDNVYPEPGTPIYNQSLELADRHFQLAHRHKISLIDEYIDIEYMEDAWTSRLSGELFTAARGYGGVGVGVGNNVYAIGTYSSWPWQEGTQEDMWANTDAWVNWFDAQDFPTPTDYFLYLIDESDDYPQIERWAGWMNDNPGPGQRLMSLATIGLPTAAEETPSLDVPTSWYSVDLTDVWGNAADGYATNPDKRFYLYNSNRPGSGSFAIEDEGVALRELAWGQYKMGVDRWFYWESTYYNNDQGNTGQTNVFQQAHTYGDFDEMDEVLGETGWNYLNGDGVLFYPGTDTRFPEDSYGVMGPFASIRLKHWRRGVQDVDYLTLAAEIDPERTAEIINRIVPKVLWEVSVSDPEDPTWVLADISWPTDPNVWEAARAELADIIESQSQSADTSLPPPGDTQAGVGRRGEPLCSDPRPALVTDFEVRQTPDMPEPAPRVPFRDSIFGTCLVRVTDRTADLPADDPSPGLKNEYSRVQSFNADGSRVLVRSIEANWYLYDAHTLQPQGQLPLEGEPRWDAGNPDLLYYTDETRLMAYDVRGGEQSLVHDFATDFPGQSLAAVWTRYEGSPSLDGRYWGLMAEDQDWLTVALLVYDRVEDRVIATRDMRQMLELDREIDSVTISPLGDYFLAYHDKYCEPGQLGDDMHPCGLMVYDRYLENGRGLLRIVGHSDTALDAQGREVLVYQDIDTDHISMLDLGSGTVTPLWPIDFSHTPIGLHFSGRASQGDHLGWALVSTYSGGHPTDYTWMDDQVFAIELKPGGRVARLAHTHSLVDENQEHDYWAEPHASVSPDFTRIVFTSNWGRSGTGEVEMFMLELAPDWTGQLP